ncbi:MAG: hypothetical protein NTY80_00555 [candidate division SR1 bacterium]|nr:hypothetical protein [candidate division SR1 bacterium]
MKNGINKQKTISSLSGIDHIFSQMKKFLEKAKIEYKEDIVIFLNTIMNEYTNDIITFHCENQINDKKYRTSTRNEEDEDEGEEPILFENDDIMKLLLHDLYRFRQNDFEWQINNYTSDKDAPLTSNDIYVFHNMHTGTLEELAGKENFDEILKEFQQAIITIRNRILWILEKEKRLKETNSREKKQKAIEAKNAKAIKQLLSSTPNTTIIQDTTLAKEEDFIGGYTSVKNIIHEVYAEQEEYFNNLFLGFDFKKGRFQTSKEKEKQYEKYFYEKKGAIRIQEKGQKNSNKELPAIISQASLELTKIMKKNTMPIPRTDEQKIDAAIERGEMSYSEESEKNTVKKIILERFKKKNLQTEEEKHKEKRKVINTYYTTSTYKKRKLNISATNSSDINTYISNHIRDCTTTINFERLFNNLEKILTSLPDKRENLILKKIAENNQKKKEIGNEIFDERFDFEELKKNEMFMDDIRFYTGIGGNLERAYRVVLKSRFPGNERVREFLDKRESLDDAIEKYIQDTLTTYGFLQDIERIKTLEKEIQEKFDPKFVFNSEILGNILKAIIKQVFGSWLIMFSEERMSNIEKDIFAMSQRISFYGKIEKKEDNFVRQIFEESLHELKDFYQLEIFIKIIKKLGLSLERNKTKVKEILQKGYNDAQYNISDFGINDINFLEKIKGMAVEFSIALDLPKAPPLETYYIHRLRTPERILEKQMKENMLDRYTGVSGYQKGNLASIRALEELGQEIGMPLRREEALNIDMRSYKNILLENRFDLKTTVPVAVNFPKVEVVVKGNWNEKCLIQGHYVFHYNPETKLYGLLFDDSFMDAKLLIERYKFSDQIILGGGFIVFDKETKSILIEDRIEDHNHEPRILSITGLRNAVKDSLPGYKIFIGNDGVDQFGSYF